MKPLLTTVFIASGIALSASAMAAGRNTIDIVGSSTVYPFSTVVAEHFGKIRGNRTPKVEATGTGGGMKLFCKSIAIDTPDIANASRRMTNSEFQQCQKNGVNDIVEILIGYDGIVVANSRKSKRLELTRRDIFLALARQIPARDGSETLVPNYHATWKSVNVSLPNTKIEVLGLPPTSGIRETFAELALEGGCKTFPWIKAIKKQNKKRYKTICHAIREDGAYIEAGENDNLIVQKLEANPSAFGVFGFSFLDQNIDYVQGSLIDGSEPDFDNIADGTYPVSRPLYFYVKKAHIGIVPGIHEYMKTFTSEAAFGPEGYLSDKGLIPLPQTQLKEVADDAKHLKLLTL